MRNLWRGFAGIAVEKGWGETNLGIRCVGGVVDISGRVGGEGETFGYWRLAHGETSALTYLMGMLRSLKICSS